MLNNWLKKFVRVKTNLPTKELNLQSFSWCEHEKSWLLIYFSTSWCAPCKKMAPIMNQVSVHYADYLKVIKIDVDEQTELAKQLGVTGVPTLVLLDQSGAKSRLIGGVKADDINRWLKEQIN